MDQLPLPENLVAVALADPCPDRREWIAELPRTVGLLADRWALRVGAPFQPGGQCSWVAPARDGVGRDVVLKVGWAHEDGAYEADALRRWDGDGAVILHDSYAFANTSALLLETCMPGTPLSETLAEPDQDAVIADLLSRLWRSPTNGPFRSLQSMCRKWADEFDERLASTVSHELDPALTRAGMQLFRELPATASRSVLLCTDLHAENVLAAERDGWLVIDPKPHIGDPTYDLLQHMLNCRHRLEQDPVAFAHRMARLLDLDGERLLLWLFARSVQESIDSPWLCAVARRLSPS